MSTTAQVLLTADEFARLPEPMDGSRQELIRGVVLTMPPPGFAHGECQGNVFTVIKSYVRPRGLGRVTIESGILTGFDPDTVRGPDVAYWSQERLPLDQKVEGYLRVPPDLCVEVLSPGNRPGMINDKIREYFFAGVRMVWVVDPEEKTVVIYRQPGEGRLLWVDGTIRGDDVIPGFECKVAEFFV